tara:strand:- start:731 stop:1762 length:1032 start_codon:yes stop_codon:yes gene_type:complete
MTNFKKRKTSKRHNKNNRKKRTRKLKGGNQEKKDIINNINIVIKAQQLRHPIDFKKNNIWNNPDGQINEPKWLSIRKKGSLILPGIGGQDNDGIFKSYRELERVFDVKKLKKLQEKIIKDIHDYNEWTKKCKPFDKKDIVKGKNKLTCDKLAEQRKELGWENFDCRSTNLQESNTEPPQQGLPPINDDTNPQVPLQTEETPIDEDYEDNIPVLLTQYPYSEEGATQLDGRRAKAIFDFDGLNDELSFDKGDEITVTEYNVDDSVEWAKGYKMTDPNKIGIFPKNHTTLKEEVEGNPNWYREVEDRGDIFRKYNGRKMVREQTQFPQVWHSSGTRNLVNQPTDA